MISWQMLIQSLLFVGFTVVNMSKVVELGDLQS